MKEMFGNLADGEIEFYKSVCIIIVFGKRSVLIPEFKAMEEWERIIPVIQRIRVDV
jgi:sorting nexin-4